MLHPAAQVNVQRNNNTLTREREMSETEYACNHLDSTLSSIELRMSLLLERLAPVIEDHPASLDNGFGDTVQERSFFSPLGNKIMNMSMRASTTDKMLLNLLNRLAV